MHESDGKEIVMFKAVYLDMGGVILGVDPQYSRTESILYSIRTKTVRRFLGDNLDIDRFVSFISETIDNGVYRVNAMDQGDSWRSLVIALRAFTQREPSHRAIRQMYWDQIAYLQQHLFIYPHVFGALRELASMGLRIGLISNVFHPSIIYRELLSKFRILDVFDPLVYSSDLRFKKPDRRIFEYAMARHADLHACESMFVGDTYDVDVVGAIQAGMFPVWLNRKRSTDNHHGVDEIVSLEELPDFVRDHR